MSAVTGVHGLRPEQIHILTLKFVRRVRIIPPHRQVVTPNTGEVLQATQVRCDGLTWAVAGYDSQYPLVKNLLYSSDLNLNFHLSI